MSSKIAEHMQWHASRSTHEGILRHPSDSEAWKNFDLMNPQFASDPRNVRLGLATDGFNPFGDLRNDIDVYLRPLIEELKELWNTGVETFDSHKKEVFHMHATILWTISDFPSLGTLSGWNTHTRLACPRCNFDTTPKKIQGHKFRLCCNRFDGSVETRNPPLRISGINVLQKVQNLNIVFGKEPEVEERGKRQWKGHHPIDGPLQWRKKSIFFELPYCVNNLLHHNLDVMHIEKNVCDNVVYTLLNQGKKSKDNLKARNDLKDWDVRPDLWPDANNRYLPAIYTLTKENKHIFMKTLKNITVPDGYSSNISRCVDVKQFKLGGLKHLCNKVLKVDELNQLQNRVVPTLCHMEMLFPPAYFTVMVHLIVHLVEDAKIEGPVQYRWMYPIERYLGKLKSYVRNKAQPEGSIAEGYLTEESLTFCSRYLDGIETIFNRIRRVDDEPDTMVSSVSGLFPPVGKPVGGFTYFSLSTKEKLQAHRHIKNDLNGPYSDDLKLLAMGPIDCAKRYNAYNVNGFKFRTLERDDGLKTQNSGIFGTFVTRSYVSSIDNQMQFGGVPYYGKLVDIIEINYNGRFSITLFKCMWANTTTSRGIITDDLGFRLVNFTRLIHIGDNDDDEPNIQAAEAQMVYYVVDELDKNWSIPLHLKPQVLYDIGGDNDVTFHDCEPFEQQNLETLFPDGEGNIPLTRSY
ncbi:uncharacterized protein LOC114172228 [Vigna unguiculata]|uniref:uncharacterized protein LOC114172228 n=1 Tax=Vigna unguiculata TaxID=3917 RepID=UPI001016ACDA|nr:uncharacterized protein LOC114172228 [Vigna unguiculata]